MRINENGVERDATPEEIAEIEAVRAALEPGPVPAAVSARQLFQALAQEGRVTAAEALAAVRIGQVPAALAAMLGTLAESERFPAEMRLSAAASIGREDALTALIGETLGLTPGRMDDLFRLAAGL